MALSIKSQAGGGAGKVEQVDVTPQDNRGASQGKGVIGRRAAIAANLDAVMRFFDGRMAAPPAAAMAAPAAAAATAAQDAPVVTPAAAHRSADQPEFWQIEANGAPGFAWFPERKRDAAALIRQFCKTGGRCALVWRNGVGTPLPAALAASAPLLQRARAVDLWIPFKNARGRVRIGRDCAIRIWLWRRDDTGGHVLDGRSAVQNRLGPGDLPVARVRLGGRSFPACAEIAALHEAHIARQVPRFDIVLTWVDGADPSWQARRASARADAGAAMAGLNVTADDPARYQDNEELRLALRAIEIFMDDYNMIYLVTDGQRPRWLVEHPRLKVIDHREIFPDASVLPTFNSHAIEACLHRIEGLCEHFVYFNDDVILCRPVDVAACFPDRRQISHQPSTTHLIPFGAPSGESLPVNSAAMHARRLLATAEYVPTQKSLHLPFALIKSELARLEARFAAEFAATRAARFRQVTDIGVATNFFIHHMRAEGRAQPGSLSILYCVLGVPGADRRLARALGLRPDRRPHVICVNQVRTSEGVPPETARNALRVLEDLLPEPSCFEAASES